MQKFWEQHPEDGGSRFLCSTGNSYWTPSHHILYDLVCNTYIVSTRHFITN